MYTAGGACTSSFGNCFASRVVATTTTWPQKDGKAAQHYPRSVSGREDIVGTCRKIKGDFDAYDHVRDRTPSAFRLRVVGTERK